MGDFKVSDIKITPFQNSTGAVQAFANALINDSVWVSGFTIVKGGKNGLFLGWPSKRNTKPDKDGKDVWSKVCWCVDKESGKVVEDAILAEYHKGAGHQARDKEPDIQF